MAILESSPRSLVDPRDVRTPRARWLDGIQWAIVALVVACAVALPVATGGSALPPMLTATVAFAALHGFRRYGTATMLFFIGVTTLVSNALENLSIATGFPFGHYHYTSGLFVFQVPVEIGPIYIALGYISWSTAAIVLDRADERLDWRQRAGRVNVVALPMVAAAVMTMYDVGTDSVVAGFVRRWVWHDGGGLFGVPYTNYLGWWFVTYLFFQVFTLWLSVRQMRVGAALAPASRVQPVLLYASLGLTSVPFFFSFAGAAVITDEAGVRWSMHAMNETLMVFNLFSVVPMAAVALFKIARGDGLDVPQPARASA